MHDTITVLEILIYMLMLQYKWVFILLFIISHAVYTYYFWMSGTRLPILGMVPFARAFLYRSLSGISLGIVIPYCIFSALALYLPSLVLWGLWLVFSFLLEWKFAQSCIDDKQLLFALIPPYKLIRLFTDARALSYIESEE